MGASNKVEQVIMKYEAIEIVMIASAFVLANFFWYPMDVLMDLLLYKELVEGVGHNTMFYGTTLFSFISLLIFFTRNVEFRRFAALFSVFIWLWIAAKLYSGAIPFFLTGQAVVNAFGCFWVYLRLGVHKRMC